MEKQPSEEPDYDNVSFMDEYPELAKRVWLRRLNAQRQMGGTAVTHLTEIIPFPRNPDDTPDGAA